MYDIRPNIVFGFHGCDLEIRNELVNNPNSIKISTKPYDWLGNGMYFWENNYTRALEWAENRYQSGSIKHPAVVGAVIQLGYCCDLLDSKFTQIVKVYYNIMAQNYSMAGKTLPENNDAPNDPHKDKLIRKLDCATLEFMHSTIKEEYLKDINEKKYSDKRNFDSTRGVFVEGGPAFDGAGFFEKSHIQICVRNLNCIKGFFIPRDEIQFPL